MSRTIAAGLATHLATVRTSLTRCVRLDLHDTTSLGLTDHDTDLTVNLGDGPISYSANTGIKSSAVALSLGLEADSLEIRGPIGDTVSKVAVLGGKYRGARVRLFDARWDSPTQYLRLLGGKVYDARVEGEEFVLEVRSAAGAFNQSVGRTLSPYCNAEFGSARCGATAQEWDATVAAVTDDLTLELAWVGATPTADDVRNGLATFTTGDLAGTWATEIFALTGDDLSLYMPLAGPPQIGDALTLREGCDWLRETCVTKQGNADNFRGFPDLTGTDDYLKYPAPG